MKVAVFELDEPGHRHAVAEHAVALVLALDRKIHRAHARIREGNFSLDGLVLRRPRCLALEHEVRRR